jgi:hypothetical protein
MSTLGCASKFQRALDSGHSVRDPVAAAGIVDQYSVDVGAGRQVIASQDINLAVLGCDVAQGYHLSCPLPAVELERWLGTSSWGRQGVEVGSEGISAAAGA